MSTLTVGPGKQYGKIASAITAAKDGDTIRVDAGTYANDYALIDKSITLEGVGGVVRMTSSGLIPNGKAILIVNRSGTFATSADVTIKNFEFSGARVSAGNGAGIRLQGGDLTLDNTYFHDNENGLLSSNVGSLTITDSEFAFNGYPGSSQMHNLYVGTLDHLTIDRSYFHDVKGTGHEVKSRAKETTITNSRIYDLNSTASYSIDVPNGGKTVIKDNVIEQGAKSVNNAIIAYGYGVQGLNAGSSLLIEGNTIVNDKLVSGAIGVMNRAASVTARIEDNDIYGLTATQIATGLNTQSGTEFLTTRPTLDTSHPPADPIPVSPLPDPEPILTLTLALETNTGWSATDYITSDPSLAGTATAGATVSVTDNGASIGTTTADLDGSWSFEPVAPRDGWHLITAKSGGSTATLYYLLDQAELTGLA